MGVPIMDIYAHRGSSGTHPENTIAAFHEAARLPIYGVEFDVHLTKDGELVVIHDETIDRTSDGKGFVKDMTLAELRAFDFGGWFSDEFRGEPIPTLQEVLEVFFRDFSPSEYRTKIGCFSLRGDGGESGCNGSEDETRFPCCYFIIRS